MTVTARRILGNTGGDHDEAAVLEAIEELISAFGLAGVMSACLKSRLGDEFERNGGNGALRVAQVVLRTVAFASNPRLEADIMAMGVGLLLTDRATMTRLGVKYGISKQAISKRIVKFCDENALPPSCYMRSKRDRKTYALTNKPRSK